jgi:hypothetical protein
MTKVQEASTLESLAREPGSYGTTGTVDEQRDIVILGRASDGWIEVCQDETIRSLAPETPVVPLADSGRQAEVLRSALLAVAGRDAAALDGIRSYAIEKHRDGMICHEGLNDFLRAFDLEEYEGE